MRISSTPAIRRDSRLMPFLHSWKPRLAPHQHAHPDHPQRDYRGKDDRGDPGEPDGFSRVGLYQAYQHRADTGDHYHPPQPYRVLSTPGHREPQEDEGDACEEDVEQGSQGEVDSLLGQDHPQSGCSFLGGRRLPRVSEVLSGDAVHYNEDHPYGDASHGSDGPQLSHGAR